MPATGRLNWRRGFGVIADDQSNAEVGLTDRTCHTLEFAMRNDIDAMTPRERKAPFPRLENALL